MVAIPGIHHPSTGLKIFEIKTYHIHSSFKKSIIERTIQHIKDRTEGFDDCFPCRKEKTSVDYRI
jgi:putative transposase